MHGAGGAHFCSLLVVAMGVLTKDDKDPKGTRAQGQICCYVAEEPIGNGHMRVLSLMGTEVSTYLLTCLLTYLLTY